MTQATHTAFKKLKLVIRKEVKPLDIEVHQIYFTEHQGRYLVRILCDAFNVDGKYCSYACVIQDILEEILLD